MCCRCCCWVTAAGLLGNHIDVRTGEWVYQEAGIGSQMDSYYEYLLKACVAPVGVAAN